jgi:ketosteroid isomerase-like protein
MTEPIAVARRLYDAFAARDGEALLAAMTEDFVGHVSAGMPLAVGGRHDGREAMLRDVWLPVFGAYDLDVAPERYLTCAPEEVVVLGSYRGAERATGRSVDARFAHILTLRDEHVAALEQITDTRRWTAEHQA